MLHLELYLPTKEEEESPQIYVNKKLVPLAQRLHEMTNKLVCHGAPEDMSDIDMIPQEVHKQYSPVNTYLATQRNKKCTFKIDKDTPLELNGKLIKVMFKATVYSDNGKPVAFRLIRSKTGDVIRGSVIQTNSKSPIEIVTRLPVGNQDDHIKPFQYDYHIEGKYVTNYAKPICRRFSLSIVYA